jgi:hypothetical protein
MKPLVLLSLVMAGLLIPLRNTLADQMIPLPIETLSAKADLVIHGTVTGTTVQRDPEGRIYTSVDIQVQEVWKGTVTTNHFTLVHGGGVLGDEIATVSGEAQYSVGEEVVSFMVLNKQGQGVSVGLSQGKFMISRGVATGEKLAHNRFHGLRPSVTNPPPSNRGVPLIIDRLTLTDLKQRATGGGK